MDSWFASYVPDPPERHAPTSAVVAEASECDVPALAMLQTRVRGGSADEWVCSIERARCSARNLVITAKVAGEAVGYAIAGFFPEHPVDHAPAGYYMNGVTVNPAWRRRGVGSLLTRRRMEWVWERGSVIWCVISGRNRASLEMHRKLGFDCVMTGSSLRGIEFIGGEGWLMRAVCSS